MERGTILPPLKRSPSSRSGRPHLGQIGLGLFKLTPVGILNSYDEQAKGMGPTVIFLSPASKIS